MLLALLLCGGPALCAQPAAGNGAATPISAELLQSKIKEVEADSGLSDSDRGALIQLYRKAQSDMEAARGFDEAAKNFAKAQESALKEARALRDRLAKPPGKVSLQELGVSQRTPLADLQQILATQQADKSALETRLGDIDAQLRQQINRPTDAHTRLTEARKELDAVTNELASQPAPGDSQDLAEARRWSLQMQQASLKAEIHSLEQELLSQPMRVELLQAQRDQVARSLSQASERVTLLQALAGERHMAEAEKAQAAAAAAQRDVAGKDPLLRRLAEQNAALTDELAGNAAALETVNGQIDAVKQRAKRYEADFKGAQQKLEIAGLSEALGRVLLERRRLLPDLRAVRKSVADREQLTADVGLQQIRHSEERRDLSDIDGAVDRLLGEVPETLRKDLRPEVASLLASRRDLLDKTIAMEGSYLRGMVELDLAQRQLIDLVSAYDNFLAEHLLWIPSVEPLGTKALAALPGELRGLLSPGNWLAAVHTLVAAVPRAPTQMLLTALVVVLLWAKPRMRRVVQASATRVGDPSNDRLWYTTQGLLMVFLRALPWPLLTGVTGWLLERHASGDGFVAASGMALQLLAPAYLNLRLFALMCESGGVGERHFRWPGRNLELLRRQIHLLMWILLPAAFVVVVAGSRGIGSESLGLARLAFVVLMLSLAHFFARVLSPREGVVREAIAGNPRGLLSRLRYLWYPLAVGIPVVLAGLSLIGYFYAAGVLTRSLVNSLWLILGLVLVHDLVLRWLLLARLRLSLHQVMQQQAAASAAQPPKSGDVPPVRDSDLDLVAVDAGTRKLLNTALQLSLLIGLWLIWSAVLPAFAVLHDIPLWRHTGMVDGSAQQVPITLADLAFAVVVGILTAAAARNLPAVLEILLLRRLDVEPGTRYAYATLLRYLLVGVGVVVVFSTMGGSWSEIQWLVAALGVGIGFGLQEIVANFVSGLVILFERPIRVGDIVTVGDTTGVVSRIRIRATTITNWDRQELLVPNKEFITNRLLNWSLSDPVNRITVDVGVAYGSDVTLALQLLAEAAREHPNVLSEPEPLITFDNFGDNSLNLKMRCYLPNIERRLLTRSELLVTINRKFADAGIVIAFPQRDVHLDATGPLEVRVTTPRDEPPA